MIKKIIMVVIVMLIVNITMKSISKGIDKVYEQAGVKFDVERIIEDKVK